MRGKGRVFVFDADGELRHTITLADENGKQVTASALEFDGTNNLYALSEHSVLVFETARLACHRPREAAAADG